MVRTKDRERLMPLLDISSAATSPQALRMLEAALESGPFSPDGEPVRMELLLGDLLLSARALGKMTDVIRTRNAQLETIYAELPQTQQAALGLGFLVREKPPGKASETRPVSAAASASPAQPSGEVPPAESASPAKPTRKSAKKSEAISEDPVPTPQVGEMVSASAPASGRPRRVSADMGATLYRAGSLRSGQTVQYPGNVIILGDVHSGSEVIAGGSIVVWGELRGIAHAGADGNRACEIRALRISAIQLRIADVIARRPDRMYYHKPRPTEAGSVTPERAAVADGEIQIFLDVVGK